jgi:hypothetical protein
MALDGRWRAAVDPHPAVRDLNVTLEEAVAANAGGSALS